MASMMHWMARNVLGPTEQPKSAILMVLEVQEEGKFLMSRFSKMESMIILLVASIASLCKNRKLA